MCIPVHHFSIKIKNPFKNDILLWWMMETSCYGKYHHDLQWLQKHPILMVFLAGKSWPIDPVSGRTKRPSNARDPSPRRVPDFVFLTSADVLDVSGAASGRVVFVKLSGCESWPLGAKVVVPRAIAGIVISMGEIAFPLEMDEHKWLCLGWKNPTYRGRCFFFSQITSTMKLDVFPPENDHMTGFGKSHHQFSDVCPTLKMGSSSSQSC